MDKSIQIKEATITLGGIQIQAKDITLEAKDITAEQLHLIFDFISKLEVAAKPVEEQKATAQEEDDFLKAFGEKKHPFEQHDGIPPFFTGIDPVQILGLLGQKGSVLPSLLDIAKKFQEYDKKD